MKARWLVAAPLLLAVAAAPARAPRGERFGPPMPPTPYDWCEAAITAARTKIIPETLLPAMARVESGRVDPMLSRVRPWPWTINVEGVGTFFETKEDAIATVQALQAKGVRSIDVGCMQVNLFYHPAAFATLEDAFDPVVNASYAVRFLLSLYAQARDWGLAAAYYHSQLQAEGEDYQRRVFGRIMTPMGPPIAAAGSKPAGPFGAFAAPAQPSAFGAFAPPGQAFGAFGGAFDAGPAARTVQPTARR